MIDLVILGFMCISVAAFIGTKDNKNKKDVIVEEIDETPT